VLENIKLGGHHTMKAGVLSALVYGPATRAEENALRGEVERRVIDFLEIDHIRHRAVDALPYGLQKRVELARALAMRPRVLLLDEPVAGMNREETEDMARFILDVQEEWGVTVLLVEHDMGMVMDISSHVVVLNFGEVIAAGTPAEVRRHPHVVEAYLGSERVGASA
jgi:branched-chain amino acid transport system ATP-binding protein